MEHLYLVHLIFLVSFHLLVLGVGKERVGGDAGVRKWNGFAHYCISVSGLFLTNAWSCISFPPPICFSPRGSREFMCPWGHGEDYLWSMHRPPVHAVHFGPCWCLSSCCDLNTGTSFTCISLVLFGVWRYHAGTHYQSPCIPAICLWSPSLCASLGPKTAHPLVPPPPPLVYQNSWITCLAHSVHGEPVAFSQAIHLAPSFHQCSFLLLCQFGQSANSNVGLCWRLASLPAVPELSRYSSVPPCLSALTPHFTLREWGQFEPWFLSYPLLQPPFSFPCSARVGRQEPQGPAVTGRRACVFMLQVEETVLAAHRLLILGTQKQQGLGFTEGENTAT